MVICVDFDGTIAKEENYPGCGDPVSGAIDTILFLHNMGGNTLILNTLREGDFLKFAIDWLIEHKIDHCFPLINENLKIEIHKYGNDPRKIAADMYIDDRAFGWSNWQAVQDHFFRDKK